MTNLLTDKDTDFVFFSEWIKDFRCFDSITEILDKHRIRYGLLPFTKDYWVRDFMPVQISDSRFIQYRYNPDYLQKSKSYITAPTTCCKHLHIKTIKTDIVLDGGNVIKCPNAVIMTDKVFVENPFYSTIELINRLERLFEAEIIIIPWDKNEPYGHADGMVRFINGNKILLNNYVDFDKSLRKKLIDVLSPRFDIVELHYDVPKKSDSSWVYINFSQLNNLILLPAMGIDEDIPALQLFKEIFDTPVEQVNVAEIARKGGALNCVSWNIKHLDKWKKREEINALIKRRNKEALKAAEEMSKRPLSNEEIKELAAQHNQSMEHIRRFISFEEALKLSVEDVVEFRGDGGGMYFVFFGDDGKDVKGYGDWTPLNEIKEMSEEERQKMKKQRRGLKIDFRRKTCYGKGNKNQ